MALQPFNLDEMWDVRTATPGGDAAERGFATIGELLDGADVLVLNRPNATPLIVLPWDFWRRALLTIAKADGADPASWKS